MYLDLMIPISRAIPKTGVKVLVRDKDNHIMNTTTSRGKFVGVDEPVSWLPAVNCKCTKIRFKSTNDQKGRCKTCGTKWI